MKYVGKLYGKIGRTHIPLVMTSGDVDRLEAERNAAFALLREHKGFVAGKTDFDEMQRWWTNRDKLLESANARPVRPAPAGTHEAVVGRSEDA